MSMAAWSLVVALLPAIVFLCFYLRFRAFSSKYWSRKGVTHLEPVFLLGNLWRGNVSENVVRAVEKLHLEHRKDGIVGLWLFQKPALLVTDLDLVKRMLIKDFNHFRDRGFEVSSELDPLAEHLFLMSGVKWRNLRVRLAPTFTSGKMKMMFPTMVETGESLRRQIANAADRGEAVEVKDVLARFATDVIASCAFGLDVNSLENPDSEFRKFGKKIFRVDARAILVNVLLTVCPKLFRMLSIRMIRKDVSDFFLGVIRDTVESREREQTTRKDFLQLLIQLIRAGKVEDVDKKAVDGDGLDDRALVQKFTLNQAAAQCFVFFGAGFETSSTALTFALYELALNPDIQRKLQEEMDASAEEFTYEAMSSMAFLDMFVQETLRKYPPVGFLQRECGKDYELDGGITVDRGTPVLFSVSGFHKDPDLYPDPERFDPYRFAAEEKAKRDPLAYLPFGEGPRSCIGNRFALMQIKVALVSVLRCFDVGIARATPIPLRYEVRSFIPSPAGGMPLMFTRRN